MLYTLRSMSICAHVHMFGKSNVPRCFPHNACNLTIVHLTQGPSGDIPAVVPNAMRNFLVNATVDISWTSAYPRIANFLHLYYGNVRVLRRLYPSLQRYMEVAMNV